MSVTLIVKLNRLMPLDEIDGLASSALGELLGLDRKPVVTARLDGSDRAGSPSNAILTENSNRVVCSLARHDEKVAVTPMTVPVQLATDDGSYSFADQSYLSIGWHFRKSPLCWVLVGAVALGIARSQGSEIEDNAGFFTRANIQGPDEFCDTLRIRTPQADLERAAEEVYAKMPKSAEIAEWLARQST